MTLMLHEKLKGRDYNPGIPFKSPDLHTVYIYMVKLRFNHNVSTLVTVSTHRIRNNNSDQRRLPGI